MKSIRSEYNKIRGLLLFSFFLIIFLAAYISRSYGELFDHFVGHEIVFIEDASGVSNKVSSLHADLFSLLSQSNVKPETLYESAMPLMDRLNALRGELAVLKRYADMEEGVAGLEGELKFYQESIANAVEMATLDERQKAFYLIKAEAAYLGFNQGVAKLIYDTGAHVRDEAQSEMRETNQLVISLAVVLLSIAFAALLVLFFVSSKLSRNLLAIHTSILDMASTNGKAALPEKVDAEELVGIVDALRVFERNKEDMQHYMQELMESRFNLQNRVDEQTEELNERMAKYREVRRSLVLSAKVMEATSEAVIITDRDQVIVDVNDAYCKVTGYSREEVIGERPSKVSSGHHDTAFYRDMWGSINSRGQWEGEIWDRRKNGDIYPTWLSINAVYDKAGEVTHYVGVFRDITDIKTKEQRLKSLANYDPLTELPNRRLCEELVNEKIARAQAHGTRVALMYLDLDGFKNVNDSLGHSAGDSLLYEVGQRLSETLRSGDLLGSSEDTRTVARLGGDEFLIAIGDLVELHHPANIAARVLSAMQEPIEVEGREFRLGASIGIAVYPEDGGDYETLCRNADTAMYEAKSSGKGKYLLFAEEMNAAVVRRLDLEYDLAYALAQEEFELHFQPKVRARGGEIVGVEALLRWNNDKYRGVGPNEYIAVAEQTGLIVQLGNWILNRACMKCAQLNREFGKKLHVAVNVSPYQIENGDILESVRDALSDFGLAPQLLELEITEGLFLENHDGTRRVIDELRRWGVKIALDDFGTGYSSLSQLREIPIDVLKIDRSFIRRVDEREDRHKDIAIIQSIIQTGHVLGMQVVAEGVETAEQAEIIASLGCDMIQGYHFYKPLQAADLAGVLRQAIEHTGADQWVI